MRKVENKVQTLTTGRVNFNKQRIPNDVINWDKYDKNPVLLYNVSTEGHGGVVVGKVVDRKLQGDQWTGRLEFMENVEAADIAFEKYSQGALNFVSIGGIAIGKTVDGVFIAASYEPREFSLVKHPANIDCSAIDISTLDAEERAIVEALTTDADSEVRYVTLNMDESEDAERVRIEAEENAAKAAQEAEEERKRIEAEELAAKEKEAEEERKRIEAEELAAKEKEAEEERLRLEAEEKEKQEKEKERLRIEAEEKERLNGRTWHERNINTYKSMPLEFKKLNCDEDFQKRMGALNMAFKTGASNVDNTPENVETIRVLCESMLNDYEIVCIANATKIRYGSENAPAKNALELLVECAAAGGAADATLAAADLGVIKYLSLFYEQLLANDTFRRSIRYINMTDKEGAIYIESGIKSPIYVGNVSPRNVPNYFYEDIKRTVARKVFTFQPIVFEHAELAILAYDKQSLGIKEQMGIMMEDISTFWLQVIGNTPNVRRLYTTGDKISSQGKFPIEAPNSNVQISKPNLNDIIMNEGLYLDENYILRGDRMIEMVLPSNIYTAMATDPELRNALTRENQTKLSHQIWFSGTRITPRTPVLRYDTAGDNPELDPSMYADFATANDGTFTALTPAVTTADHIGAGISFVENGVLAGVGSIELIVAPDPNNYGTKISGWVSTGCTIARQNGVGATLIVPSI